MRNFEFVLAGLQDVGDECDRRELFAQADEIQEVLELLTKLAEIQKESFIKEVQVDGTTKYEVKSESNPDWSGGVYSTKDRAKKRLRQVEFFKHVKPKK